MANATEASLDKIKRQLASGSGRNLLQGPLLKRSETVLPVFLLNFDHGLCLNCSFIYLCAFYLGDLVGS